MIRTHFRTRAPQTRLAILALAALLPLLGLAAAPALAAPGDALKGNWKATAMEVNGKRYPMKGLSVTFAYKAGGVFVVTMTARGKTQTKTGKWSATGSTVTMTVEGKRETMPYRIKGRKLTLTKKHGGRTMLHHMVRVK